jgi:hypothetical protein
MLRLCRSYVKLANASQLLRSKPPLKFLYECLQVLTLLKKLDQLSIQGTTTRLTSTWHLTVDPKSAVMSCG